MWNPIDMHSVAYLLSRLALTNAWKYVDFFDAANLKISVHLWGVMAVYHIMIIINILKKSISIDLIFFYVSCDASDIETISSDYHWYGSCQTFEVKPLYMNM